MIKRLFISIAQLFRSPRLFVSLTLPILSLNSASAEVTGTRVQLGHFGIDGQANDYSPLFQHGTFSRSYPYGSISATAGSGTLSLVGQYASPDNNGYGNADLKLNSYFADTVTIDAPGHTGQPGSFTVSYVFDGSYDANEYYDSYVSINCAFGIDAGDGTIPNMEPAFSNGFSYRGNDTYSFAFGATLFLGEEQTQTLAFTFGEPFDFWMKLGARLHITESEPGDARLAVSLVKWSGFNSITAGGLPVTNATASSVSGTNWTQAVISSLPLTTNQTQVAQVELTPTSIILRGTNGPAHGPFHIFSSSDLTLPAGDWPAIYTNRYDASGNFDTTNSIVPAVAQGFFRVQ
jgi:hypothetical protein